VSPVGAKQLLAIVAPIQGLAMKKELCFACPRLPRPLAWAIVFQAFGLKDESPPPHVIPTEEEGSGRESFAVRRSFRVPHSEFRVGSSLTPAVETCPPNFPSPEFPNSPPNSPYFCYLLIFAQVGAHTLTKEPPGECTEGKP
jgi:hypothetical protein